MGHKQFRVKEEEVENLGLSGDFGKAHGDVSQMDTSNPRQELQKIGKLVHKTKGRRRRSIDCPGISNRHMGLLFEWTPTILHWKLLTNTQINT